MRKYILLTLLTFYLLCIDCSAFTKYVTNNLNLRYEPTIHSYVLTVIPRGTIVNIEEDCDCKWVPVEYNGYVGYISTKYLSNIPVRKSYTHRKGIYKEEKTGRSSCNRRSDTRHYTYSYGNRVQSPTHYSTTPAGATALCRDGTYSFSQNRRGTCSHHGGVAKWY